MLCWLKRIEYSSIIRNRPRDQTNRRRKVSFDNVFLPFLVTISSNRTKQVSKWSLDSEESFNVIFNAVRRKMRKLRTNTNVSAKPHYNISPSTENHRGSINRIIENIYSNRTKQVSKWSLDCEESFDVILNTVRRTRRKLRLFNKSCSNKRRVSPSKTAEFQHRNEFQRQNNIPRPIRQHISFLSFRSKQETTKKNHQNLKMKETNHKVTLEFARLRNHTHFFSFLTRVRPPQISWHTIGGLVLINENEKFRSHSPWLK